MVPNINKHHNKTQNRFRFVSVSGIAVQFSGLFSRHCLTAPFLSHDHETKKEEVSSKLAPSVCFPHLSIPGFLDCDCFPTTERKLISASKVDGQSQCVRLQVIPTVPHTDATL